MKYIKNIGLIIIATAILSLNSCADDYLDTVPTQDISDETVSGTLSGLYTALNGIHRKMVSADLKLQHMGGEPGFIVGREAHADDMIWATYAGHKPHLTWSLNTNASSTDNSGIWETYYQFILNSNKILEALKKNFGESDEALSKHIRGECLTIRAWAHFQLVQYYAKRYVAGADNTQPGIPYREASSLIKMARNSVEDVYSRINRDLDEAAILLKDYKAAGVNHYTEKTVYGLKARVALVQQNYAKAAENAVNSIRISQSEGLSIMTKDQLMNGFADITTATKEAMYAATTLDDQTVYFYSFYAYMSWNFNATITRTGVKCISQSTYDLMSSTDLRKAWWDPTGTATVPNSSYTKKPYQNRKFTARSTANAVGDVAFMRLSEMYLIAAESYARSGQNDLSKQYLNVFIAQRDPQYKDSGKTGNALAEEIMTHRRIELWGEGFRWFDLKRLNLPCNRTGSNYDISFCGFLSKAQDALGWYYEIPKTETDFNPLIEKNY